METVNITKNFDKKLGYEPRGQLEKGLIELVESYPKQALNDVTIFLWSNFTERTFCNF